MRYAVNVPNFGQFADPHLFATLARDAEGAGWDGFFVWDHIFSSNAQPFADPWILLAAAASVTGTIRLGTMVTPVPRRRPWKLARETVTLDHLSRGRMILGVGIGDDSLGEYSTFSEPASSRQHGEMLDEGLAILTGIWSGETFGYKGKHFAVKEARFLPKPVQQPRIPIFVAGQWPNLRPFRRAAMWDGVVPVARDGLLSPGDCRQVIATTLALRESRDPFEVVVVQPWRFESLSQNRENAAAFQDAGATWFQCGFGTSDSADRIREAIQSGPPLSRTS